MATVGYVTTLGNPVCLACVDSCAEHTIGRVDFPDGSNQPIEDPAPRGIRLHDARNATFYDAACALCGWAIRRAKGQGDV